MDIIHFSDTHIGTTAYGKFDSEARLNSRVVDALASVEQISNYVEQKQPDLILFTGDAFHSNNPSPTYVTLFAKQIRRMAAVCPVVIVVGNHDMAMSRDISAATVMHEMENVTVFDKASAMVFDTKVGPVFIAAIPYPKDRYYLEPDQISSPYKKFHLREAVSAQIKNFSTLAESHAPMPRLLAMHITAPEADMGYIVADEKDAHVSKEALTDIWDYVALGHIHKHQEVLPGVVYAGSTNVVSFGEEHDPKGFVHLKITKNHVMWKFKELDTRPFVTVAIELLEEGNITQQILAAVRAANPPLEAILRVRATCHVYDADTTLLERELSDYFQVELQFTGRRQRESRINDLLEEGETLVGMDPVELLDLYLMEQSVPDNDAETLLVIFEDIVEEVKSDGKE